MNCTTMHGSTNIFFFKNLNLKAHISNLNKSVHLNVVLISVHTLSWSLMRVALLYRGLNVGTHKNVPQDQIVGLGPN
jgi:hypothetical protein